MISQKCVLELDLHIRPSESCVCEESTVPSLLRIAVGLLQVQALKIAVEMLPWRGIMRRRNLEFRAEDCYVLATTPCMSASHSQRNVKYLSRANGILPGEGKLYDQIGVGNFVDLEKNKLTASLSKSFRSNALSKLLDVDLPAKMTIGGRIGTLWFEGFKMAPVAKVALSIRLLDLGASDSRQAGFLRFKAATRTNGRSDHGFEIDRKISVFNMPSTTLYGNVAYKTNNRANGVWKSSSSFGVHQDFRFGGLKFAARVGMTPEGEYVYDLRL